MKKLIIYTKDFKNAEKVSINIIKNNKNTKIFIQNNIEKIFIYKKKICKEKECKIIFTKKDYNGLKNKIKTIKNCLF